MSEYPKVRISGAPCGVLDGVEGRGVGVTRDDEGRDWVLVHPERGGPVLQVRYEHVIWLGGVHAAASCPKIEI